MHDVGPVAYLRQRKNKCHKSTSVAPKAKFRGHYTIAMIKFHKEMTLIFNTEIVTLATAFNDNDLIDRVSLFGDWDREVD